MLQNEEIRALEGIQAELRALAGAYRKAALDDPEAASHWNSKAVGVEDATNLVTNRLNDRKDMLARLYGE